MLTFRRKGQIVFLTLTISNEKRPAVIMNEKNPIMLCRDFYLLRLSFIWLIIKSFDLHATG
jgi:hypothetical protein